MSRDLKDVTFTIPVRFDTNDRIENITLIVDFLLHNFNTNIMVMEEAKEEEFSFLKNKVDYHFIQTDDPNLHRTKCLNDMAKLCKTSIIANYDTDVLFCIPSYLKAAEMIRSGEAEMVLPYAGRFLECPRSNIDKIKENYRVGFLKNMKLHCNHPDSVGGCIFWNKETFMRIGLENQNFKSWGWEDNERMSRANKLGVKIKRTEGDLYHISHKRLGDSKPANPHYNRNRQEFTKVNSMKKEQLIKYIKSRSWTS